MSWVILFLAGLFEIGCATGLKYSEGINRFWPTVSTVTAMLVSFWLVGLALKNIPVATADVIWLAIGAVGTAVLGVILFSESTDWLKVVSLGLICVGIVGLRLAHT